MFMAISQVAFTLNDALVKLATGSLGVGQIMLVRGMFASALMAVLVWRLGQLQPLSMLRNRPIQLRILGEIGGTVSYLIALAHLPLANVSAMFQALPLAITMSAALFFGDHVGPRRWIAIIAGFIGVLIIVRPGMEGFNAYSIYVLVCVAFCAVRDLATRAVPDSVPSSFVSLLTAIAVTITGAFMVPLTGGWKAMDGALLLTLFTAALLVLTGYQFIIQSMRVGEISFVAPFRYTALIWAIGAGYFVFHTIPDPFMLLGASIIVASGLYTLYRERVAGRTRPVAETTGPANAVDGV